MAKQTRRTNPGDAANTFVRVILSDVGRLAGGFTEEEWDRTVKFFEGRCAYTGAELQEGQIDRDHAIPLNRSHCGVHLYGNVLPTTKQVNRRKGGEHYRDFVKDEAVLEKIETFVEASGYSERVAVFGDLRRYCEAQYTAITAFCRANRNYLVSLLPEEEADPHESRSSKSASAPRAPRDGVLPISLDPSSVSSFKEALLRSKRAYFTISFRDGTTEIREWKAEWFAPTSSVMANLRSRFRPSTAKKEGIVSVHVTIERPDPATRNL